MRISAAETMPTTAHDNPSNVPEIQVTSPCTAYTHDSATIRTNAGRRKNTPAARAPGDPFNSHPT